MFGGTLNPTHSLTSSKALVGYSSKVEDDDEFNSAH